MRILVADDQRFNILAMKHFFSRSFAFKEGDVVFAVDGQAAVKAFKANLKMRDQPDYVPINLVLLDHFMPFLNGLEVVEAIKDLCAKVEQSEITETRLLPKMLIQATICSDAEYVQKALELGVDECVCKPIKQETLAQILLKHGAIVEE